MNSLYGFTMRYHGMLFGDDIVLINETREGVNVK